MFVQFPMYSQEQCLQLIELLGLRLEQLEFWEDGEVSLNLAVGEEEALPLARRSRLWQLHLIVDEGGVIHWPVVACYDYD